MLVVYSDDILIYKCFWEDHVQHVDKVTILLEVHQLYADPYKYAFGVYEVDYLGHIVSHEGAKVEPKKLKLSWNEQLLVP